MSKFLSLTIPNDLQPITMIYNLITMAISLIYNPITMIYNPITTSYNGNYNDLQPTTGANTMIYN